MYHNFPRDAPFNNMNLRQPKEAFKGIDSDKQVYKQSYLRGEARVEIRNDNRPPLTRLVNPPTGFTHTGALGPNYPIPPRDPRYNLPYYGNSKPQVLNYPIRSFI